MLGNQCCHVLQWHHQALSAHTAGLTLTATTLVPGATPTTPVLALLRAPMLPAQCVP